MNDPETLAGTAREDRAPGIRSRLVEKPTIPRGRSVPSSDGDALSRKLHCDLLEADGYDFVVVADGIETLEAVGRSRPTRPSADDDGDKMMTAMLLKIFISLSFDHVH